MAEAFKERFIGEDCLIPALGAIGRSRQVSAREELHPHRERNYEIHLILDGSVHWWVEDESYHLPPDSIFITKPGELHGGVKNMIQPSSLTWLQLNPRRLDDDAIVAELAQIDQRVLIGASQLVGYVGAMLDECRRPQPDSPRLIQANLQLFLAKLLRLQSRPLGKQLPEPFSQLLDYIDSRLPEKITVEELCQTAHLSRSRIFQLFDMHVGQSPISYITSQRIRQAQVRLKESAEPVTQIALDLGFSSSQHFATVFRRHTGVSPRDFRRG